MRAPRRKAALTTLSLLLAFACLGCGGAREAERSEGEGETHEAHPARDRVQISAAAVRRLGIRLDVVRRLPLRGGIEVPAEVQLDPDRTARVSSIVDGQIDSVRVSPGTQVERGEVLAVVRSVALGETRAAIAEARAGLRVARTTHERERRLNQEGIGAQRNLLNAEAELRRQRARLQGLLSRARVYGRGGSGATTSLRSPIAGQVVQRQATVGEVVSPGRVLFVVADTSSVWVIGRVYAQDAEGARVGAHATLTLQSVPGSWPSRLDYVAPVLDEATRTLAVRMALPNPNGRLRPGLFGTVHLARSGAAGPVPTVALDAVQLVRGRNVVFVPGEGPGQYRAVPITTGTRVAGRVEVIDGIAVGARHVITNAFFLTSQLLREDIGEGDAD